MKILHVTNRLGEGAGAVKLLMELIPYHLQKGYIVDVAALTRITPSCEKAFRELGCHLTVLSKEGHSLYDPLFILKLMYLIRKYDIVHVHLFPSLYWVAFAKICSFARCKLVVTEHSTLNNRQGKTWLQPVERLVYHFYDKIIAVSESVSESLRNNIHCNSSIIIIENGVDLRKIEFAKSIPYTMLGVSEENVLIVQVARFHSSKDQMTVLRALALLPEQYHVLFVGSGGLLAKHKILADELGVSHRTHFLGVRQDVPAILKVADIVVMASNYEGFGLAAVEGMAAGKPVIASNVPGLAGVVEGAGILFKSQNEQELAYAIKKLIEDKEFYEDVRRRCIERAKMFDIRRMSDQYLNLYQDLIK